MLHASDLVASVLPLSFGQGHILLLFKVKLILVSRVLLCFCYSQLHLSGHSLGHLPAPCLFRYRDGTLFRTLEYQSRSHDVHISQEAINTQQILKLSVKRNVAVEQRKKWRFLIKFL